MTNIILLTIDALRADHCSSYGYSKKTTPNIDSLAINGIKFTNAYSPSSHTRESLPAILSGKYPHAAVNTEYYLDAPTIASYLQESHYTGAFHSNPYVSRNYGFGDSFDMFDDDLYLDQPKPLRVLFQFWDKIRNHHYARAETINDRALTWIDSLPNDKPIFIWNHYMDVHSPYEPPEPYRSKFADYNISDDEARQLYQRANVNPSSISHDERQSLINLYDGEVRYADTQIQVFLDSLSDRGLLANSLVIVTADHGDGLGDNGQYSHPRYLYDELVHVPLIVTGLDIEESVTDIPVSGLDIAPTVLSAVENKESEDPELAGTSFHQLLANQSTFSDRCVVLEARGENEEANQRRYRVIDKQESLFFERDRSSTNTPGRDSKLTQCLTKHLSNHKHSMRADSTPSDEHLSDRLEALGYK